MRLLKQGEVNLVNILTNCVLRSSRADDCLLLLLQPPEPPVPRQRRNRAAAVQKAAAAQMRNCLEVQGSATVV